MLRRYDGKFNIRLITYRRFGGGLSSETQRLKGEGTHFHLSPLKMSRASL